MNPSFQDAKVVITGAVGVYGSELSSGFAGAGAALCLSDFREEALLAMAGSLDLPPGRLLTHATDLTRDDSIQELVTMVLDSWGAPDVVVNNAGIYPFGGLMEVDADLWDQTLDINLKSCFNWCRAVVPTMQAQGAGRIANMSSLNAHSGGVTSAVSKFAYGAAKAGILGLTRALAKELGPIIHINAICPGVIETERGNTLTKSRGPELTKGICMNRLGTPQDVAGFVAYLASTEHSFMTGQNVILDGFQWIA